MDEQVLERELRDGLAELLDPIVGSHPRWATSETARRVAGMPARHTRSGRWALLWAAALLALLLAALLAATLLVGSRPEHAVVDEASDILATTRAHALPVQAICPPGSDPDTPGPADQERPSEYTPMAFDRHAGRIVALAGAESGSDGNASQTWTYDVCTNTWQRMRPPEEPVTYWGSPSPAGLVYDADSDRTLAFGEDMRMWSYELAADRWTEVGSLPWAEDATTYGTIFYHDPSGLVVAYDGVTMWAYDVETDTLLKVRQRADPARPEGSGMPHGKVALGYDPVRDLVVAVVVPYAGVPDHATTQSPPLSGRFRVPQSETGETWTFDPGTGQWRLEAAAAASDLIVCGVWWTGSVECYPTYGRTVFDEASGLTLFITRDYGRPAAPGRIDAYDAGQGVWRTLSPATGSGGAGPYWCASRPPVYDPLDERVVCQGVGGTSAFSTSTGEWRWLLEPVPAADAVPGAAAIP